MHSQVTTGTAVATRVEAAINKMAYDYCNSFISPPIKVYRESRCTELQLKTRFAGLYLQLKRVAHEQTRGVNFIKVLTHSFYASRSQKGKNLHDLTVFFSFLGSTRIETGRKMMVKLTLGWLCAHKCTREYSRQTSIWLHNYKIQL